MVIYIRTFDYTQTQNYLRGKIISCNVISTTKHFQRNCMKSRFLKNAYLYSPLVLAFLLKWTKLTIIPYRRIESVIPHKSHLTHPHTSSFRLTQLHPIEASKHAKFQLITPLVANLLHFKNWAKLSQLYLTTSGSILTKNEIKNVKFQSYACDFCNLPPQKNDQVQICKPWRQSNQKVKHGNP